MRDRRYKLSGRYPLGYGDGRATSGNKSQQSHICGTVICSMGVFLYLSETAKSKNSPKSGDFGEFGVSDAIRIPDRWLGDI